ncbi:MAG: HD domain-containing protein [Bacteroidales bacterium]
MDNKGAEKYIIRKLEKELPEKLYYHSIKHTLDVTIAAVQYGIMENLTEEELILVKIAALYHDSGFLIRYLNNEETSAQIVQDTLPAFGFTQNQIGQITKMILSTEIHQKPKTLLEKILCDADLDYLGRDDFFMNGICLQCEWNEHDNPISLKEWYIHELYFLQQHEYYTKSAMQLRQKKKLFHLKQIRELLGESV